MKITGQQFILTTISVYAANYLNSNLNKKAVSDCIEKINRSTNIPTNFNYKVECLKSVDGYSYLIFTAAIFIGLFPVIFSCLKTNRRNHEPLLSRHN